MTRTIHDENLKSYMRPTEGSKFKEIDRLEYSHSVLVSPRDRPAYICDVTMGDFQL
jgi:hypothetical protein